MVNRWYYDVPIVGRVISFFTGYDSNCLLNDTLDKVKRDIEMREFREDLNRKKSDLSSEVQA